MISGPEPKCIFVSKWIATVGACTCAIFSSLDIYPWNVHLGAYAGILWCVVGVYWREPSIIAINLLLTIIYGAGVIRSIFIG